MTRSTSSISPLMAVLAGTVGVIALLLFVIGAPEMGLVAVVAFLVLAGATAFDAVVLREKVRSRGGDRAALKSDAGDSSLPVMPADDGAPLGANEDSHVDLDPVDFPPGHGTRHDVEQAQDEALQTGR
jgi:hypothetical protein